MRLILVRHGETDHNRSDDHVGHSNISLNATGQCQAERLAEKLAVEKIDKIYSSDFLRAKETAQAISPNHPQAEFIIDAELRERDLGEFISRSETERINAEKTSGQSFRDWKPQGGESLRDLKVRAGRWYAKHRVCDADKVTMVISHGMFIYCLLEWIIEGGEEVERPEWRQKNGAITILNIPPSGKVMIELINDTSHLQ